MLKKRIKEKLKSKRGTSIFFGLLLFVAASILSVVIINAAVTTVKRVTSDKKAEQNYLSCSSAAKLLQEAIVNTQVVSTVTTTKTATGATITQGPDWTVKAAGNTGAGVSLFGEMLKDYVKEYITNNLVAFGEKKLTISVPSNVTDRTKEIGEVTALLSINSGDSENGAAPDPGCYITVKLTTGTGTDICKIILTLNGSVATESRTVQGTGTNSGSDVTTTTTTYSWSANDIFYGAEKRKIKESQ